MKPYRRIIFSIGSMLLLLTLVLAGCSRQSGPAASDNSGTEQQMPFDRPADKKGVSPTASPLPASIPAGTPIAIRLQSSVSSASSQSRDSFDAALDEPVVSHGRAVPPRVAPVPGKLLEPRAAGT